MRSANRVIIASAGSGKTTSIVRETISKPHKTIAIVTYTINNAEEIRKKFFELHGHVPPNVTIATWFSFLLRECVRPYQNFVYDRRIESIAFVNGKSTQYVKKTDTKRYYFSDGRNIYTDKISEYACECNAKSSGLVLKRLSQIYDELYIDEVQDLAGYDLDLIELFLKSPIEVVLVGDHRQATYSTNSSPKNLKYRGQGIVALFRLWEERGLCEITYLAQSHRCNQAICDFSDQLYPDMPKAKSENHKITGHDGIFLIPAKMLDEYIARFSPTVLRYDRRTDCRGIEGLNFGDSKGLTFDRVLIFPNGPINKYLATGNLDHVEASKPKLYVAITRARHSVAFVYEGKCQIMGASVHQVDEAAANTARSPDIIDSVQAQPTMVSMLST